MQTIENIKSRRSVRKFKPEIPPAEHIREIVEAGTYAATGMNKQSPIIIAVTDRTVRNRLQQDNAQIGGWREGFDPFYGAPAILIVLADKTWANRVYDGSLVLGNMMLAAHELGLGSCWIHRAKEEFEMPEWREWLQSLGITGEYEGIGHLALGYCDGEYPKTPIRKENWAYYVG